MKFFDAIKKAASSVFRTVGRFFASGAAEQALQTATQYLPEALEVVSAIASQTPNRTDDEIADLAKRWLGQADKYLATARFDRGLALLQLATDMLASAVHTPVATNILQTAIQIAYTGYKAEVQGAAATK